MKSEQIISLFYVVEIFYLAIFNIQKLFIVCHKTMVALSEYALAIEVKDGPKLLA